MTEEKSTLIGRVIATEKAPTTIDNFGFWTQSDLILNPFDIVKVQHVNGSFSYGVIEDISHITDAASFLTNFISSDFGDVECEGPTLRVGMNYVQAKVICNTDDIYIPLQSNAKVFLANANEIEYALGLKNIKNPLVCGYIEMYKGTKGVETVRLPVKLNSKFIIGPEGAHLNISGISGLASKTSYAMFLIKAIQDQYLNKKQNDDDSVAFVLFNVKGQDLLTVDCENDFSDMSNPEKVKEETLKLYKDLQLDSKPIKNVKYYYPYSTGNYSNTYMDMEIVKDNIKLKKGFQYKYIYSDDKESLDLLFSNIDDSTQTMEAIITKILEEQDGFDTVKDWNALLKRVREKSQPGSSSDKEIPVASWRKFLRIINKAISDKNAFFANRVVKEKGECRLGDVLKYIRKNEVHVIDIAKLAEDKQAFVFGDVVRTIYNLQLGEYSEDIEVKPPSRIIIFIDELNKYASKDTPKNSPILKTILDVAERGRSLGIVLFGAEQFRGAIHDRVTGNCSSHAYGRTNSIEVNKQEYRSIPPVYKTMMTRLQQGEYIVQNPVFRSLLSIKFPLPIYKQTK